MCSCVVGMKSFDVRHLWVLCDDSTELEEDRPSLKCVRRIRMNWLFLAWLTLLGCLWSMMRCLGLTFSRHSWTFSGMIVGALFFCLCQEPTFSPGSPDLFQVSVAPLRNLDCFISILASTVAPSLVSMFYLHHNPLRKHLSAQQPESGHSLQMD